MFYLVLFFAVKMNFELAGFALCIYSNAQSCFNNWLACGQMQTIHLSAQVTAFFYTVQVFLYIFVELGKKTVEFVFLVTQSL
jgi:hypothetical protein